jgi:hypothetical protein
MNADEEKEQGPSVSCRESETAAASVWIATRVAEENG